MSPLPETQGEPVLGPPGAPHARTLRGGAEKAASLLAPLRLSTLIRPPRTGSPRGETRLDSSQAPSAAHPTAPMRKPRAEGTGLWHGSKPAARRCSGRTWWKMRRLCISVSVQLLATTVLEKRPQMSRHACRPARLDAQRQAEDRAQSARRLPTSALSRSRVLTRVAVTNTLGRGNAGFPISQMGRLRPSEVR